MNYLWKVTVKKINSSEMVIGMWVEILKRGTTGRPTHIEIANALNEKYKTNISFIFFI